MKQIRRSAKYRTRLKEVLAEQQSAPAKPLAKGGKQGSRARKCAAAMYSMWAHPVAQQC